MDSTDAKFADNRENGKPDKAEHVKQATPTLADKLLGMELGTCLGCGSDEEMQRHRGFHKRHLTCINWSAAPCSVVDEEAEKGQAAADNRLDELRSRCTEWLEANAESDDPSDSLANFVRTEAARAVPRRRRFITTEDGEIVEAAPAKEGKE